MKYLISVCVSVITVVLVLDIIRMLKARKQVNEYKYKVFNWINVTTILVIIIFMIGSVGSLLSYFKSHRPIFVANAYIFSVAAIQYSIHLLSSNYICDTGIWYWGQLYKWNKITSCTWTLDEHYVVFKMKKKFLGVESELKFRVKESLKEEIKVFLNNHFSSFESTS